MKKHSNAWAICLIALFQLGCSKTEQNPTLSSSSTTSKTPTSSVEDAKVPKAPQAPSVKSYDGPFGLAMGVPITELVDSFQFKKAKSEEGHIFSGTPPKPAAGFDSYFAVATEKDGICRLVGIADVDVVNGSGDQIKSETDRIAGMIESKYGKHTKKYDFSTQDVYERNPEFWMLGLKEDSVFYAYDWVNGKGDLTLPNNIIEIEVEARAYEINRGFVRLIYTFSNSKSCQAEIKKQEASNL